MGSLTNAERRADYYSPRMQLARFLRRLFR